MTLVDISKAFKAKDMNISEHVVKQLLKRHGFVERKMQKAVTFFGNTELKVHATPLTKALRGLS